MLLDPQDFRRPIMVMLAAVLASTMLIFTAGSSQAAVTPPVTDAQWQQILKDAALRKAASRVPGSVLGGASRGASVGTRIAGVSRSVSKTVASGAVTVPGAAAGGAVGKFGTLAKGAGTAVTGLFVLDMTYTAFTGGYGGGFGFGGMTGASGDGLWCDLQSLSGSAACSLAAAPVYVPNSDVGVVAPPGWKDGVNAQFSAGAAGSWWTNRTVTVDAVTAPVFGATPFSGEFLAALAGTAYSATNNPGLYVEFQLWCSSPTTGVVSSSGTGGPNLGTSSPSGLVMSKPRVYTAVTCASGGKFDHVEITATNLGTAGASPTKLVWYPEGHALRPPDESADPERRWITTQKCNDGAPSTTTSAVWRESDATWPSPPEPACTSGELTYVKVVEQAAGLADSVLYEWTVSPEQSAFAQNYPQCTDATCTLELQRVDSSTAPVTRLACFDNPSLCTDWFTDPAKVSNYVCTYGGTDVDLTECNMYAPTFKREAATAAGVAYGDPETGASALPEGSVVTPANDCPPPFAITSVINPYWYYKGVVCALETAFVPTNPAASFAGTTAKWNASTPVVWVGALGHVFDGVSLDESGCQGPGGVWAMTGMDLHPFSACDAPMSGYAVIAKTLAGFFIGVTGLYACINAIGRAFGYDFGPAPVVEGVQGSLW